MMPIEGHILNLWNVCREGSRALGPGLRYVVWTQGCLKRCPGCTSPESQQITPRMIIEVSELAKDIINNPGISGITISGGEPFLQAASLTKLLELVKRQRSDMNVIVFTGYQKEELLWADAKSLLEYTDVLIDGPYEFNKKTNRGLRGSSNQRILFLTDTMNVFREEIENGLRRIELFVEGEDIVTIGIPN